MTRARRLTKVGDDYAVIIPKKFLAMLGMDEKTLIEFVTDGRTLIIRPVRHPRQKAKVAQAVDRVFTRYRKTMRTLSQP